MAVERGFSDKAVSEWSNEEIQAALSTLGGVQVPVTSTTRSTLEKRVQKLLLGRGNGSEDRKESGLEEGPCNGTSCSPHRDCVTSVQPANGVRESEADFEGYYGVTASAEGTSGSLQLSPFYTSLSDTLKEIKNVPGARFKKFNSQANAEAFSNSPGRQRNGEVVSTRRTAPGAAGVEPEPGNTAAQRPTEVGDKPNQFPSLKTPCLSKFRQLIESGNNAGFAQAVGSNPRYLINCDRDAPEILQPGCRYNALHCAVKAGNVEICKEIMSILHNHQFWDLVYPSDSQDAVVERKKHLIYLYLNMQDKTRGDTPLHLASKLGHEEIVDFLLSFPSIDTTIKNKEEKMAAEVVCANTVSSSTVRERIVNLLSAPPVYYVPVFRTVDNCTPPQLTPPCRMEEYRQQESAFSDDLGTPIIGQAFAGPMSPAQADDFYHEWRSPSRSLERKEAQKIKRSDASRGFERVGRQLAHQRNVGWLEYWDFLGCYCDLTNPAGLDILEQYLTNIGSPQWQSHKRSSRMLGKGAKLETSGTHVPRILFPRAGNEEDTESDREVERNQEEEEEEEEEDEGGGFSSEPPVTDLDSVIESMASISLASGERGGGGGMRQGDRVKEEEMEVREEEEGKIVVEEEEEKRKEKSEGKNVREEDKKEGRIQDMETVGNEEKNSDRAARTEETNTTRTQTAIPHSPQTTTPHINRGMESPDTQHSGACSSSTGAEGLGGASTVRLGSGGVVTPTRTRVDGSGGPQDRAPGFLVGPNPTRLDRDVMLAVSVGPDFSSHYPLTSAWLYRVKAFPEKEQKSWQTPPSSWDHLHGNDGTHSPAHHLCPPFTSSPPLSPLSPLHHPPTIPSPSSPSSPRRLFSNLSPRHNFSPLHRSQYARSTSTAANGRNARNTPSV